MSDPDTIEPLDLERKKKQKDPHIEFCDFIARVSLGVIAFSLLLGGLGLFLIVRPLGAIIFVLGLVLAGLSIIIFTIGFFALILALVRIFPASL